MLLDIFGSWNEKIGLFCVYPMQIRSAPAVSSKAYNTRDIVIVPLLYWIMLNNLEWPVNFFRTQREPQPHLYMTKLGWSKTSSASKITRTGARYESTHGLATRGRQLETPVVTG